MMILDLPFPIENQRRYEIMLGEMIIKGIIYRFNQGDVADDDYEEFENAYWEAYRLLLDIELDLDLEYERELWMRTRDRARKDIGFQNDAK